MDHALEQEKATKETEAAQENSSVSWFQRQYPNFFTAKVVEKREGPLGSPFMEPKRTYVPVTRKLTKKTSTHVNLHIDGRTKTYFFKCIQSGTHLPVERSQIVSAITEVHSSEWVRIPIGTEVLRLKRAELRAAFHELDKL